MCPSSFMLFGIPTNHHQPRLLKLLSDKRSKRQTEKNKKRSTQKNRRGVINYLKDPKQNQGKRAPVMLGTESAQVTRGNPSKFAFLFLVGCVCPQSKTI